ncbi:MAG TPA: ATP-binding protein [Solirubrobacteraceae bacterium]
MGVNTTVIDALQAAVASQPDAHEVRLHLAGLLLLEGDATEASRHAGIVLASIPDHQEAMIVARDAARALGDTDRASAYERLLGMPSAGAVASALSPAGPSDDRERVSEAADQPGPGVSDDGPEAPRITLADVGGMEEVKRRLDAAFLAPLRNPKLREYYGKSLRGGLLLYGPPGCGKTFIARALAGELGASFFSIGLSDVLDMWLGESERRLHEAFEEARRAAPCVLFLDEVDALGRKRSQLRQSAGRNVINQLLAELDGVEAANHGLFVLAATNHPWDVDTALRRPGRLDRTVLVLPPDAPARAAILERAMEGRPVGGVDFAKLASRTPGFSGADLVHLCEVASERALQDSIDSGRVRPIGMGDFDGAAREVAGSTKPWFSVAHGYAIYANEGGQYDDLLAYIRRHKLL